MGIIGIVGKMWEKYQAACARKREFSLKNALRILYMIEDKKYKQMIFNVYLLIVFW